MFFLAFFLERGEGVKKNDRLSRCVSFFFFLSCYVDKCGCGESGNFRNTHTKKKIVANKKTKKLKCEVGPTEAKIRSPAGGFICSLIYLCIYCAVASGSCNG